MPALLANATISTTRKGAVVLQDVPLRVWPMRLEMQIALGIQHRAFQFNADRGLDLAPGDVVTGWNPLGTTPAPTFLVRHVIPRDGLLAHLEGILETYGQGAFST